MMFVTYIVNPALIINEIWGPYVIMYSLFVAGACFTFFLIFVGLHCQFLRRHCPPFLILLKFLMKMNSTIFFIPSFSIHFSLIQLLICSFTWKYSTMLAKRKYFCLESIYELNLFSRLSSNICINGICSLILSNSNKSIS